MVLHEAREVVGVKNILGFRGCGKIIIFNTE